LTLASWASQDIQLVAGEFLVRPGGLQTVAADSGTLIDVRLPNGRPLWCWKYVVAYTCEGFKIRTPSEECNQDMLDVVQHEATRYFGGGWPVHVIQPARECGEIDHPPVRVTAFLTSSPMRNEMHLSSLVVVWFQGQQFPVPDEAGRAALEAVNWERLALDYET
jgi:hypothetical protein